MNLVEKAREFAKARHEGQYRRGICPTCQGDDPGSECLTCNGTGKVPYFTHCEKVASLVEGDIEKAIAYLHDTIEDGRATGQELEAEFGKIISDPICDYLTHYKAINTYEEYIHKIARGGFVYIRIKIADFVANLSDSPTQKQIEKYNKALRILAGV